jgi:hypothetical protein
MRSGSLTPEAEAVIKSLPEDAQAGVREHMKMLASGEGVGVAGLRLPNSLDSLPSLDDFTLPRRGAGAFAGAMGGLFKGGETE